MQTSTFKETFALHEVLKLATTALPNWLKRSTAVDHEDNAAMHDACKKERSQNAQTHDLIKKLIWHQLEEDLTLELRWVCSEENCLAIPEHTKHARGYLRPRSIGCRKPRGGGGIDMVDMMATDAPTQLIFYSRLQTNGTARVDVLNHNVSNIPGYFPHNRP